MHGKAELSHYFVNNSKVGDWLVAGAVKGRPAVLVFDPHAPAGSRRSFKLLGFAADKREGRNDERFPPRALGDRGCSISDLNGVAGDALGQSRPAGPALYFLPSLPSANYGAAQRTARPKVESEAHSFRLLPKGDLALKTRVRG